MCFGLIVGVPPSQSVSASRNEVFAHNDNHGLTTHRAQRLYPWLHVWLTGRESGGIHKEIRSALTLVNFGTKRQQPSQPTNDNGVTWRKPLGILPWGKPPHKEVEGVSLWGGGNEDKIERWGTAKNKKCNSGKTALIHLHTRGRRLSVQRKRDGYQKKNGEEELYWCSALIQHGSQDCRRESEAHLSSTSGDRCESQMAPHSLYSTLLWTRALWTQVKSSTR